MVCLVARDASDAKRSVLKSLYATVCEHQTVLRNFRDSSLRIAGRLPFATQENRRAVTDNLHDQLQQNANFPTQRFENTVFVLRCVGKRKQRCVTGN